MNTTRIHRAVSADGTEIVGRVVGEGPPLVLVHGAIGDGEFAWTELLPHLIDRFACHLPSTRGRGLSGDHPDHSIARLSEDITAYVAGIEGSVGLLGWSGGGPLVLGAAAQLDNVATVATWESGMDAATAPPEVLADLGRLGAAMEQVGMAAAEGRLADALDAFLLGICSDQEIAAVAGTDFRDRWTVGVPELLVFFREISTVEGPGPLAPEALARVSAPTLLLAGTETLLESAFPIAARRIAAALPHGRAREVAGVGHFAPVVAPEVVAAELTAFLDEVPQPA